MTRPLVVPPGEQGPLRALVVPILIVLLGGIAVWAFTRSRPDDVKQAAAPTAPAPPPAGERNVAALTQAAPPPDAPAEAPEMDDVTVPCPLAPGPPPRPASIAPYWHDGSSGFDRAEREHSLTRMPMLVYFFTDWCGYCKAVDRNVWARSDVDRYLRERIVKVKINPEKGRYEDEIEKRFRSRGYPSLFLVLPGAQPQETSWMFSTPQSFVSSVQHAIEERAQDRLREATSRQQSGDLNGAIEAFDDAIALVPERADSYYQRALAYRQRGDLPRILDDFAAVLALEPHRSALFADAGESLAANGRHDEAVACWSQRLQIDPQDARAWYGRSVSHHARGDRARARSDAAEACRRGQNEACALASSLSVHANF